jgi:SIR2-like domain
MPERIVDACLKNDLVVFAGAGVSTESRLVLPWTIYSEAAAEVGSAKGAAFPSVMSAFQARHGRAELLQLIKRRFDYINAFGELRHHATRFHELATLFYVDTIVTTNWDTYFEEDCGTTPIVTPKDYAFWGLRGRKVFKIHGSMNNVGSVVATEADYEACYESLREGVVGSTLKHILATKTIAFLGYSFRDDDFARIYGLIRDQLGEMLINPVIVTLDSEFDGTAFPGATIVTTDAAYFIEELKRELLDRTQCLLPDAQFSAIGELADLVLEEHLGIVDDISLDDYPMLLYTACYQDGLLHSLGRILTERRSGTYSHICEVAGIIRAYERMRKRAVKRRRYWDSAYIEGYINGMTFLLTPDPDRWAIPFIYMPGAPDDAPVGTREQQKKLFARGEKLHKTAFKVARKIIDAQSEGMLIQHPPVLLGLSD